MPAPQANVKTNFSVLNDQGELEAYSPDKIKSNVPTYFITHGLTGTAAAGQPWQKDMVESLEAQNDGANVIQVSWDAPIKSTLAKFFISGSPTNYEQAAANTQTVGQNLLDVIEESDGKIDPGTTTLIGHSLGAQVSGWAGFKAQQDPAIGKIGTIVGLDPARPSFQNTLFSQDPGFINATYKSPHRLVSSDADRVVAIHTSKRFGYTKPVSGADGNDNALDIYVNGGSAFNNRQDLGGTKSHNYSHDLFQDLLDGEGFDKDRNKGKNSKPLGDLRNPDGKDPLISLNTILQGNGSPGDTNRGIVDIKRSENAEIPDGLSFGGTGQSDVIAGTKQKDKLLGKSNSDILTGLQNDDELFGGAGNDELFGGAGDDTLTGVNTSSQAPGAGEIDILTGGAGNDEFALTADVLNPSGINRTIKDFYSRDGDKDFALIEDFNLDRLLTGSEVSLSDSAEFNIPGGRITNGVGVTVDLNGQDELIAIVENITEDELQNRILKLSPSPDTIID